VLRWWLAPLAASVGLLSAAALASFLVVRVAELLHASDEYAGLLLAGSAWPVLAGALLARRWMRRRRAARQRPIAVRGGVA
jgi:glutamate/tyrosine decarboxylase-like PLP-dependent enzyme